ncbi:hypothetical protein J4E91_002806 [Alternaria rosae]|nr:hypothetical protein J4E91_002806 [Alternaria rosae]
MSYTGGNLYRAKAGGTGLTINEASQVIFVEPWWNSLDALQAERRAVRIGQEKLVHVWVLTCINSFSDAIINTGALRKLRVIDKIMAALRTAKGAEVDIPPHVPQFGKVPLHVMSGGHNYAVADEGLLARAFEVDNVAGVTRRPLLETL